MLHIDRIRIHLPSGYEHRAALIASMVGDSLAGYQPAESRQLDTLTIGPMQVMEHSTDIEIASKISQQIKKALERRI
jgi:hypothetical protein